MELENSYYWFKQVLTPTECQKIIDLGLNKIQSAKDLGVQTEATTKGYNHKQGLEKQSNQPIQAQFDKTIDDMKEKKEELDSVYIRDSEVAWLNDQWLYDLVYPYLHEANRKAGWNYDFDISEQFQFTKYGLNQFYGWHSDGSGCHKSAYKRYYPGVNGQGLTPIKGHTPEPHNVGKVRKLSVTINLNEPGEYEGGLLNFDYGPHSTDGERYKECTEIKPQGSIIVFPSFLHHQVTPVTKGTRYSLVLWITGRPFR